MAQTTNHTVVVNYRVLHYKNGRTVLKVDSVLADGAKAERKEVLGALYVIEVTTDTELCVSVLDR